MSEKKQTFNPENVQQYFGKIFVTESGSNYSLTRDGKFTGRPSIEGAEIMLIAGIRDEYHRDIDAFLDTSEPELKDRLDDLIRKNGEEIKPGLRLVVSLTPECVEQKGRYGMITSLIKTIK